MKPVNGLSLTTTPSKRDHNTFTWLKKAKRKLSLRQLTLLLNFSKVNINCPLLWTVCFLGERQMAQTHLREPLDSPTKTTLHHLAKILPDVLFLAVMEPGRLFPSQDPRLSHAKLYWHFLIYIPP